MDENDMLNDGDNTNPYDMLSDLRDYLEDMVNTHDDDVPVELELSVEEIEWILDRIEEEKGD